jgi:hypothetical protein
LFVSPCQISPVPYGSSATAGGVLAIINRSIRADPLSQFPPQASKKDELLKRNSLMRNPD